MNNEETKNQVVILCATNRIKLLKKSLPYIIKNVDSSTYYIVTSSNNFLELSFINSYGNVILYDEDKVISGLSFETVENILKQNGIERKYTGWYLQQFIKMAWAKQEVCSTYYTVWDSDTIPLQKIDLFWDNKPCINLKTEFHKPYFDTINDLLNIKKQLPSSFISEFMTFSKNTMLELINSIENVTKYTGTFYDKIIQSIMNTSKNTHGFSEFETYGTFTLKKYPNSIIFMTIPTCRHGTSYCGKNPSKFDLLRLSKSYSTVSFEPWSKKNPIKIFLFKIYSFMYCKIKKITS